MGKDRNNKKPVLKPALLIDKCIDSKNDNDDDDRLWSVFSTLVLFTALMFIVPLGCYFLSKSFLFEGYFNVDNSLSPIYAAVLSVILVNIIIGTYVYVAWKDAFRKEKEN